VVKSAAFVVVVGVTRPFLYYFFWNIIRSREDCIGGCGIVGFDGAHKSQRTVL
jgi:hypothetical protein